MVFHTKPTPDEFNENVFENVNEELEKEIIQNVSNIYIYIYIDVQMILYRSS